MGGKGNDWTPGPADAADGVRVRDRADGGRRIEIDFQYRGVRCRERFKKLQVTQSGWEYAVRVRGEILNAIERGTFNYADFFPHSKRAILFGCAFTKDTVGALLMSYLAECEVAARRGNLSPSTVRGYRKIIENELVPEFGAVPAADFGAGHLRAWMLKQDCTIKTIRNKLSPLTVVFEQAVADGKIKSMPYTNATFKSTLKKVAKKSDYEVDPFDLDERAAFLAACANDEERDFYTFWFETGLRPGELIALSWSRIDWIKGVARIDQNLQVGVIKAPKTAAGKRSVELTPEAVAALKRQKARTFLVGGRVWREPRTMLDTRPGWSEAGSKLRKVSPYQPWRSDAAVRDNSYVHVMKKAGVRWRNMYQIRHTYASMHASAGKPLVWIANQMGHETVEMVIKHYARWIPGFSSESKLSASAQSAIDQAREDERILKMAEQVLAKLHGHAQVTGGPGSNVVSLNSNKKG